MRDIPQKRRLLETITFFICYESEAAQKGQKEVIWGDVFTAKATSVTTSSTQTPPNSRITPKVNPEHE